MSGVCEARAQGSWGLVNSQEALDCCRNARLSQPGCLSCPAALTCCSRSISMMRGTTRIRNVVPAIQPALPATSEGESKQWRLDRCWRRRIQRAMCRYA